MPEKCSTERSEASRAADRYYKVVSEWIRGRMRSETLRREARRLAEGYRRSLDLVIRCFHRIRGSSAAKREVEHARELKDLLEKDIEILGTTTGDLKASTTQSK